MKFRILAAAVAAAVTSVTLLAPIHAETLPSGTGKAAFEQVIKDFIDRNATTPMEFSDPYTGNYSNQYVDPWGTYIRTEGGGVVEKCVPHAAERFPRARYCWNKQYGKNKWELRIAATAPATGEREWYEFASRSDLKETLTLVEKSGSDLIIDKSVNGDTTTFTFSGKGVTPFDQSAFPSGTVTGHATFTGNTYDIQFDVITKDPYDNPYLFRFGAKAQPSAQQTAADIPQKRWFMDYTNMINGFQQSAKFS